jgi:hypothetical protein
MDIRVILNGYAPISEANVWPKRVAQTGASGDIDGTTFPLEWPFLPLGDSGWNPSTEAISTDEANQRRADGAPAPPVKRPGCARG